MNNYDNYKILATDEVIQEGDEFCSGCNFFNCENETDVWTTVVYTGYKVPEKYEYYYRRKVNKENYRYLAIGEITEIYDEFNFGEGWAKNKRLVGHVIHKNDVGEVRRPTERKINNE